MSQHGKYMGAVGSEASHCYCWHIKAINGEQHRLIMGFKVVREAFYQLNVKLITTGGFNAIPVTQRVPHWLGLIGNRVAVADLQLINATCAGLPF